MPKRKIVLTDRQADFVAKLIDSGRYQDVGEVISEGLWLVEWQEAEKDLRLKAMREAVGVGIADIEAGRYQDFVTAASLRDFLSAQVDDALADSSSNDDGER